MRYLLILFFISGLVLYSCDRTISGGISLDELEDKQEYTQNLSINGSSYNNQSVKRILVNGKEHPADVRISLAESGYYRFQIYRKGGDPQNPDILRIVILDDERGEAEWGLKKWTPQVISIGQIEERAITLIHPVQYPAGADIPLIVIAGGDIEPHTPHFTAEINSMDFLLKQGIGSIQIPSTGLNNPVVIIDQRSFPLEINPFESSPLFLQGQLQTNTRIPAGTLVSIKQDLTIPSGTTLTIESGSFISLDPGINIYNEGILQIDGSAESPVTFTCSESGSSWGGFIGNNPGNEINASHAIFCNSGHHTGGDYNYGHAHRQALVYSKTGILQFDHCYIIDNAGQIFYPVSASLEVKNSLVQRAKTGGQINNSELSIDNTIFTDFPDDSQNYQDQDNDGLYLMGSNATISNSTFMYAKDDGLDSGGSGGGEIHISNTHFISIFHEGAALSSGGTVDKSHHFTGCTFTNCGQGLELGYSSPNHQVTVDSCLFRDNGIGIRYGDNYDGQHLGKILVSNTLSIYNADYNIWNMVRERWSADTLKMEFVNVRVSMENPMYPQLDLNESE